MWRKRKNKSGDPKNGWTPVVLRSFVSRGIFSQDVFAVLGLWLQCPLSSFGSFLLFSEFAWYEDSIQYFSNEGFVCLIEVLSSQRSWYNNYSRRTRASGFSSEERILVFPLWMWCWPPQWSRHEFPSKCFDDLMPVCLTWNWFFKSPIETLLLNIFDSLLKSGCYSLVKPGEGCCISISVLFGRYVFFTSELRFSLVKLNREVGFVSSVAAYFFLDCSSWM